MPAPLEHPRPELLRGVEAGGAGLRTHSAWAALMDDQARCYPEMLRMVETGKITPFALVTEASQREQPGSVKQHSSGYPPQYGHEIWTLIPSGSRTDTLSLPTRRSLSSPASRIAVATRSGSKSSTPTQK